MKNFALWDEMMKLAQKPCSTFGTYTNQKPFNSYDIEKIIKMNKSDDIAAGIYKLRDGRYAFIKFDAKDCNFIVDGLLLHETSKCFVSNDYESLLRFGLTDEDRLMLNIKII